MQPCWLTGGPGLTQSSKSQSVDMFKAPDDVGEQSGFRALSLWPPKSLEPDSPCFSPHRRPHAECGGMSSISGSGPELTCFYPSGEGPLGLPREETTAGTESRNTRSTKHGAGT